MQAAYFILRSANMRNESPTIGWQRFLNMKLTDLIIQMHKFSKSWESRGGLYDIVYAKRPM